MMSKSVRKSILRGLALAVDSSLLVAIQAVSTQAQWAMNGTNINNTNTCNVGIGTAAPAAKLHVAGDIRVDGNISAKYQDVAEWVPSKQKLAAGAVGILDIAHNNHVAASSTPYDTRVAGVVSAQPGISLGEQGEGKALVATTGRVKVRVDATRAPIKVGDLLVTSEVAGVAMRSQPLDSGGVPTQPSITFYSNNQRKRNDDYKHSTPSRRARRTLCNVLFVRPAGGAVPVESDPCTVDHHRD